MKLSSVTQLVNTAFQFVILNSKHYQIDESHALKHSLDVFHYVNKIYDSEVERHPFLQDQLPIMYSSAILHDMCDKKYMNETEGIQRICEYMTPFMPTEDISIMSKIVTTMSYSKVKKNGYPNLGDYQLAYHIVREADLLSAYDFERSLVYQMMHEKYDYDCSLETTRQLFETRILTYRSDDLFITDYSKNKSEFLHNYTKHEIQTLLDKSL
jgi:hypothetical protein